MKIQLLKIIAALSLVCAFSGGCANKPVPVSVRLPARDVSAMTLSDSRKPTDNTFLSTGLGSVADANLARGAKPPQKNVLGNFQGVLMVGDRPAAELVATVIAARFPEATVTLTDCRATTDVGIWTMRVRVYLAAEIGLNGKTATVTGFGENLLARATSENFSRAYQRALDDMERQLSAVRL